MVGRGDTELPVAPSLQARLTFFSILFFPRLTQGSYRPTRTNTAAITPQGNISRWQKKEALQTSAPTVLLHTLDMHTYAHTGNAPYISAETFV